MIPEIFQFNHELLKVETKTVPMLNVQHAKFTVKALREEARELEQEFLQEGGAVIPIESGSDAERWQTVKAVDAALDAAYFAIGALARAGLTVKQAQACFAAVDTANKTKKRGVAASRGDMGVADAIKPADFVPPEQAIYDILFNSEIEGGE